MTCSHALMAQQDTIYKPSIRLGVDLGGFARQIFEPQTQSLEFSLDVEWKRHYFAAFEAGMLAVDISRESHQYQASGYFFRLGMDFNILGQTPDNPHDLVLLSLRYGYGSLEHEAPMIQINDPYWGNYLTNLPAESYGAHWLEAGIGLKTQLWGQLFLGWSLRGRLLVSQSSDHGMAPYFISGYGKSSGSTNLMLHYTISYRIPFR